MVAGESRTFAKKLILFSAAKSVSKFYFAINTSQRKLNKA